MPGIRQGVCGVCLTTYERAWVVTERSGEIEQLLNGYKFMRQRAGANTCVDLLDTVLPDFSGVKLKIVSIPTISKHIRHRGYDHMGLIAKGLAKRRRLPYSTVLARQTNTVQLGSSKRQRVINAKEAFHVSSRLDSTAIYLLVDDVVTTGATLRFASQALLEAGAGAVWAAAIARQPLDK